MTPQDIRERTFEKAVFGGYDMAGVDDFMEEAAVALETAQRENSTLKAKLKVLVDKIEEYRASEDAMRMTLLSAQKLSNQIETEARERADKLVSATPRPRRTRSSAPLRDAARGRGAAPRRRAQERARALSISDAREVCAYTLEGL